MDSVLSNGPWVLRPKEQLLGQLSEHRVAVLPCSDVSRVCVYRYPGTSLSTLLCLSRGWAEVILVMKSGKAWKLIQSNLVLCVTLGI